MKFEFNKPKVRLPARVGEYIIDLKSGSGSYASVYRGYRPNGDRNIFYALKFMNKRHTLETPDRKRHFQHELQVMSMVSHPNVMGKLGFFETEEDFVIVMKYCGNGNLYDLIVSQDYLPEPKAVVFFQEIASGMRALNEKNVCHRDIKPQNIFVQAGGFLVIGDFGFARILNHQEDLLASDLGTPLTKAPEFFERKSDSKLLYTSKVDIWALGCVFYFILFKKFPFIGSSHLELYQNMVKQCGSKLDFPKMRTEPVSEETKDLLTRMLEKDEKKRIGWNEFFVHPLFSKESVQPLGASDLKIPK